jgi:hypothetical protein
MSVFKKLQEARVKLQETKLYKSGRNKFAGYEYFELGDFLPAIQTISKEVGICGVISYTAELATLTIYDVDNAEQFVTFSSPMSSAALKGCHEVQNLGAVQTYLRRYLWTNAFEIVEHDALDMATDVNEKPKAQAVTTAAKPIVAAPIVAKVTAPVAPIAPPAAPVTKAPIVGQEGEWQIVAPAAPAGDPFEWLNLVSDAAHMVLGFAESEADVMAIFRKNKALFDTVKATDPDAFGLMMEQFKEVKNKFTGE